jgi:hypothetical protein
VTDEAAHRIRWVGRVRRFDFFDEAGIIGPVNYRRVLVILLLLAGFGVLFWTLWNGDPANSVKLPDGSRLTLSGVSVGPNSTHFYGTYLQRVAEKVSALFGKTSPPGIRYTAGAGNETNVVFWFRLQGKAAAAAPLRFVLVDEGGASVLVRYPASVHALPTGGAAVYFSQLPWPRRSRTLTVRVFDGSSAREQKLLGELRVKNPAPQSYPEWTADPLPISRRHGDAAFTLERFVLRPKPIFQRLHGTNVKDLLASATFRVVGDSSAGTNGWILWQARVSDATGNSHLWGSGQSKTVEGRLSLHDQGVPWLGEKVYKVETLWFPVRGYSADELTVVRGVALGSPMNSSGVVWQGGLSLGGVQLYATRPPFPSEGQRWRLRALGPDSRGSGWGDPEPRRVIIVGVRDESGRDWPGEHRGEMQLPADAKIVDVTFATPTGRVVEFMASPERLATAVPIRSAPPP